MNKTNTRFDWVTTTIRSNHPLNCGAHLLNRLWNLLLYHLNSINCCEIINIHRRGRLYRFQKTLFVYVWHLTGLRISKSLLDLDPSEKLNTKQKRKLWKNQSLWTKTNHHILILQKIYKINIAYFCKTLESILYEK